MMMMMSPAATVLRRATSGLSEKRLFGRRQSTTPSYAANPAPGEAATSAATKGKETPASEGFSFPNWSDKYGKAVGVAAGLASVLVTGTVFVTHSHSLLAVQLSDQKGYFDKTLESFKTQLADQQGYFKTQLAEKDTTLESFKTQLADQQGYFKTQLAEKDTTLESFKTLLAEKDTKLERAMRLLEEKEHNRHIDLITHADYEEFRTRMNQAKQQQQQQQQQQLQ